MTPTYPELDSSYINGVVVAKMKLFNRRNDVEYYQIEVFTEDWKPIQFATTARLLKVGYNKNKLFDVYIRITDVKKTRYICTTSKIFKGDNQETLVSSMICSKIK
tara:strand:- start:283 stop:597 length:315 start_codon:yes stop_codon:yes gene_type:complete